MLMFHMRHRHWVIGILLAGLIVRLVAAALAPHPGISDPNHYYNLAQSLAEGRGFVIDYIWQYHNPPETITHPIDYWMPLPAVYPAAMLALFPGSLFAALLPAVFMGTALAVLAYGIAWQVGAPPIVRLTAMLGVIFLPEFVLNSARTDTTISYVLYVGIASICFYQGITKRPLYLLGAGVCTGLAHLSRQDAILLAPAFLLSTIIIWQLSKERIRWKWLWLVPVGWLGVLLPWFIRNYELYGVILPSGASRTLFMTSFIDQFSYGRTLDLQHYLDWGTGNILSNIAFQTLANLEMSYLLLDIGLPIFVMLGFGYLIYHHQKERKTILILVLPLVMTLGLFTFYSVLTPFHTQGGSFKKSYMLIIPFLSVVGAYGIWFIVKHQWAVYAIGGLMATFMLLNAVELVRQDFSLAATYTAQVQALTDVVTAEGDVNGDDEIIIMTQDPFMLNMVGFRTLMTPSDPLDMILAAAYRYNADYILLPGGRAALSEFWFNQATDPRLRWLPATDNFQLLAVNPGNALSSHK